MLSAFKWKLSGLAWRNRTYLIQDFSTKIDEKFFSYTDLWPKKSCARITYLLQKYKFRRWFNFCHFSELNKFVKIHPRVNLNTNTDILIFMNIKTSRQPLTLTVAKLLPRLNIWFFSIHDDKTVKEISPLRGYHTVWR